MGFSGFFIAQPLVVRLNFGAFDQIARLIELHVQFDFRHAEKFSIEFDQDVARLITTNLVLCTIVTRAYFTNKIEL